MTLNLSLFLRDFKQLDFECENKKITLGKFSFCGEKSKMSVYKVLVKKKKKKNENFFFPRITVPPSAPVLYVSSSTSSSILLHWKPGHNGGAPLTKYTLHYRTTHGTLEEMQLSRRATSHELKVSVFVVVVVPLNYSNFFHSN